MNSERPIVRSENRVVRFAKGQVLRFTLMAPIAGFALWAGVNGYLKDPDQVAKERSEGASPQTAGFPSNGNLNTEVTTDSAQLQKGLNEYAILKYFIPNTIIFMENTGDEQIRERAGKVRQLLESGRIIVTPPDNSLVPTTENFAIYQGSDGSGRLALLIYLPFDWAARENHGQVEKVYDLMLASFVSDELEKYSREELQSFFDDRTRNVLRKIEDIARNRANRVIFSNSDLVGQLQDPSLIKAAAEYQSTFNK